MAKKNSGKDFTFNFNSDEVMNTSIFKSKNGYNYVSVNIKRGEDQYINLGYEWKGESVPDFAMDMLSFMQANKSEIEKASKELKLEIEEFMGRYKECL